jgi:hypothetical protein
MKQELTQILLECLRGDRALLDASLAALTPEEWQALAVLAAKQRVRPQLYQSLQRYAAGGTTGSEILPSLKKFYLKNTARNLLLTREYIQIAKELRAEDVQVIPLKGIYMANAVYETIGLREVGDMDLLVPKDRLPQAAQVLQRLGYMPKSFFTFDYSLETNKHLPPFFNQQTGGVVELHWSLTNPGRPYSVDGRRFWERIVSISMADTETLALPVEDTLLHLCEHISYGHKFMFCLRSFYDIFKVISTNEETLDWDYFCARTKELHWERGVFLALKTAATLFEIKTPPEIFDEIKLPDFDERYLQTAVRQALSPEGSMVEPFSTHFAKAVLTGNWGKWFFPRLLVPREFVANIYSITRDSPKIYWLYFVRIVDAFIKNGKTMWKLWTNRDPSSRVTKQTLALVNWLEEDNLT